MRFLLVCVLLLLPALFLLTSAQSSSSSSSSTASPAFSSSSSSSFSSPSSSSSSSFYNGNEPFFPGCYSCPPITQCPTYPNTSIYPAFAIHTTTSASADSVSCNIVTSDILVEVTQHAPTNACIAAIGALACFGAFVQSGNCSQLIDPSYPAMCANATACLDATGQAFVQQSKLCTDIQSFLNRPVAIPAVGSSGGNLNSARRASSTTMLAVSSLVLACVLSTALAMLW